MKAIVLCSAIVAFVVGAGVLLANPRRFANRAFAAYFGLACAWLGCIYEIVRIETDLGSRDATVIGWLRANTVLAGFLPWAIWWLKEAIAAGDVRRPRELSRSLPWLAAGVFLAGLSFLPSFILPPLHVGGPYQRGGSYFGYILVEAAAYGSLLLALWRDLRVFGGIRRLELQFVFFVMGGTGVLGTVLNGAGSLLGWQGLKLATFPFLLLGFAITAWAVTFYRIFDAGQVLRIIGQRLLSVAVLVTIAWSVSLLLAPHLSQPGAWIAGTAMAGLCFFWVDGSTKMWLHLDDEVVIAELRRAVLVLARTEPQPDRLASEFESLLCRCCEVSFATLHCAQPPADDSSAPRKRIEEPFQFGDVAWVTPESLQRQRATSKRTALLQFLHRHRIGLLLAVPIGSEQPSLMIALGKKRSQWPFTDPEIRRLQNIAELMDNILTRSRLTSQAELNARTEHLAMMSRGLAHDLKNLLTPVSSFLVHTDGRYTGDSVEAEVHAAALRSVRIMSDYVREAQFFADRLAPRFEQTPLRRVLEGACDALRARGAARRITLGIDPPDAVSLIADAVLVQRLLGNLLANAIDASPPGAEVRLSGAQNGDRVRIEVADSGCGIPPENLPRIFEPYFTTKDTGDEVRGFGLGLTICQKIAALHGGTITVHSEIGRGSTFTVELPLHPPASAVSASGS